MCHAANKLAAMLIVIGGCAALARAQQLSFAFDGTISRASIPTGITLPGPTINSGNAFSGTFTIDLAALDLMPGNPNFGMFQSVLDLAIVSNGNEFSLDTLGTASVFNNPDPIPDFFGLDSDASFTTNNNVLIQNGSIMVEFSTVDLGGDALPTSVPTLIDGSMAIFFDTESGLIDIGGDISTLTLVPTPSAAALSLCGLALLAALRRRITS